MINNLQKVLYKVSNIAPVMIFLGVSLYMQVFWFIIKEKKARK